MSMPWLREPWLNVVASAQRQRLAHAYYMQHEPTLGSEQFLQTMANFLLCQRPQKQACGQCKSCLLVKAGSHPDLWQVDATEDSSIGIDQVRSLQQKLTKTANQGGARVAIIRPADKLTEQAANAILKVLEEPPENMYWLVAVNQPEHLLPTLRSRMQWLNLQLPERQQSEERLEQAASLLATLQQHALPPVMKTKEDAQQWLDITEQLLLDLLKQAQQVAQQQYYFTGLADPYRQLAQQRHLNQQQLQLAVVQCRQLRQRYHTVKGLNIALLLSSYWQQWAHHVFQPNADPESL